MRILGERRGPVFALLLLAPSIPELLTGSTPVSRLVTDPVGFAVSFALDVGLYGTGALLIREVCVAYRRGWASILLLGGAYGIAEEGFAVHTFFQRSGAPVGLLGSYGHAFGVNWLWALGLTVFHATYSIALPILLTHLWYPEARNDRWLDSGLIGVLSAIYVLEVAVLAVAVGHGPSPAALALFLGIDAVLVGLALRVPNDLLRPRAGPSRLSRAGLVLIGALGFLAWVGVLFLAQVRSVPAWGAAGELVGIDLLVLVLLLTRAGTSSLDRTQFRFAVGMLGVLFVWDVVVEFSVPGILGVSAIFAFLLYRLDLRIARREASPAIDLARAVETHAP